MDDDLRETRDRDQEGRARNARPRDDLGRPLPYGTPGVERQPEGLVRTPLETVTEAQRLLGAGMPFHAHEVFEDAWKSGPEAERALWKGLAQLAVGLTHAARGNSTGGARLLLRGAAQIEGYVAAAPHGQRCDAHRSHVRDRRARADRLGPGAGRAGRGERRCGGRRHPRAYSAAAVTRTTSRVRGPCTPSTRSSSMSLVAEGPEIQVSGRVGSSRGMARGTDATTWSGTRTTQM